MFVSFLQDSSHQVPAGYTGRRHGKKKKKTAKSKLHANNNKAKSQKNHHIATKSNSSSGIGYWLSFLTKPSSSPTTGLSLYNSADGSVDEDTELTLVSSLAGVGQQDLLSLKEKLKPFYSRVPPPREHALFQLPTPNGTPVKVALEKSVVQNFGRIAMGVEETINTGGALIIFNLIGEHGGMFNFHATFHFRRALCTFEDRQQKKKTISFVPPTVLMGGDNHKKEKVNVHLTARKKEGTAFQTRMYRFIACCDEVAAPSKLYFSWLYNQKDGLKYASAMDTACKHDNHFLFNAAVLERFAQIITAQLGVSLEMRKIHAQGDVAPMFMVTYRNFQ